MFDLFTKYKEETINRKVKKMTRYKVLHKVRYHRFEPMVSHFIGRLQQCLPMKYESSNATG